ncbi:hypothetical protein SAMN04488540_103184 [Ferrimonas sediminum]|uniref:Uncharacterized protein n=1 Tax=Ferrimonas sediminum TaxID=718193 RepID=A0A1G8NP15_9GAMM|nr:hypothetical protein [Ferrimonas sediminum]SDI81882.1 hypothetical protein SAMN04488540_103184 [Ferrimonas sediminum]
MLSLEEGVRRLGQSQLSREQIVELAQWKDSLTGDSQRVAERAWDRYLHRLDERGIVRVYAALGQSRCGSR